MDTITTTIDGALKATGIGRTTLYKLIGENKVKVTKIGSRTLVRVDSLRDLFLDAA